MRKQLIIILLVKLSNEESHLMIFLDHGQYMNKKGLTNMCWLMNEVYTLAYNITE